MSAIYVIFLTILFNVIISGNGLNTNKSATTASECNNNTNIHRNQEEESEKNKTISKNLRHSK